MSGSPKIPKKRGRKRKQDIVSLEDVNEISPTTSPKSNAANATSKRGRKRKQINYYELANPGNIDMAIMSDSDEKDSEINAFQKPAQKVKDEPAAKPSKKAPNLNETEPSFEKSPKLHSNGFHASKEENSSLSSPVSSGTETEHIYPSSSTPSGAGKDKRYHYTGETVKMVNSLFESFVSQNETSTSSTSEELQNQKSKKTQKNKADDSDQCICAVCNQQIDKTNWTHHKQRYHNNLAWRVGDEPLDLSNKYFVMHTLQAIYKKKKPLYCDKCGDAKKSVIGFLSHQSVCKKSKQQVESVKVPCELCGRKMLAVSLSTHMKTVHSNNNVNGDRSSKSDSKDSKLVSGKRTAAKKALKIIEDCWKEKNYTNDLGFTCDNFAGRVLLDQLAENEIVYCPYLKCDFSSKDLKELIQHYNECVKKPEEGYACKMCLLVAPSVVEIKKHIKMVHFSGNDDSDDDEYDDSGSDNEKGGKTPKFLITTLRLTESKLFEHAYEWTYKFNEEHYSSLLFQDYLPTTWQILPVPLAVFYLPKLSESCDIAQLSINQVNNPIDKNYDFKKFDLFDIEMHDDNKITIFCGGPIVSLAWLPIPQKLENEDQILAVSILQSPDVNYLTNANYANQSAIQFWNFGPLLNKIGTKTEPRLMFNLAHDHGPIWHMEWCPSGCYNAKLKRAGLLAVTGSDSVVYIYSVPFNSNKVVYYKPKPVIKLLLQRPGQPLLGGLKYYPTRISWSKAKGHKYVSAGYSNGQIALFNLHSKSSLLKFKDNAHTLCILPEKNFQAHSQTITMLHLHHLNEGSRWLLTGSFDRGVALWDLKNPTYPLTFSKKHMVTSGIWLPHWLCYLTGTDEASVSTQLVGCLKMLRESANKYNCKPLTVTISQATISSVSGSDWLNGVIHANAEGEVTGCFPHQLLFLHNQDKAMQRKKFLFGYTCMIDKSKSAEERHRNDKDVKKFMRNKAIKLSAANRAIQGVICDEPVVYEEAQKRYGLVFCDNKMENFEDMSNMVLGTALSSRPPSRPNLYPLNALNAIVFNPNRQSSLFYASGYQAGFVRVSWLGFLKDDEQIPDL